MNLKILNDDLGVALGRIYGRKDRPMGSRRPRLHQPQSDSNINQPKDAIPYQGNAELGDKALSPGTPVKLRHRRYFKMSNDGGTGLKY